MAGREGTVEGRYGAVVIPAGIARDLWAALRGDGAGLSRAGAAVLGLVVTSAGAVTALTRNALGREGRGWRRSPDRTT